MGSETLNPTLAPHNVEMARWVKLPSNGGTGPSIHNFLGLF